MARTIPARETLTVEFKSDLHWISDSDFVAAIMCLANCDGGSLYLGVEDDGTITGLYKHLGDTAGISALIANRTRPAVWVTTTILEEENKQVVRIDVPRADSIVSTSEGLTQRRTIQADGMPGCLPLYASDIVTRKSDLGQLDTSAQIVRGTTVGDFDPIERERLRQIIRRYNSDASLRSLDEETLLRVLQLVRTVDGVQVPTTAGLLLLGREEILIERIRTHETGFQVLSGTQLRVNDFYRGPILKVFERITEQFGARVNEDEIMVHSVRVPLPNYDETAFREAFANALIHRDYSRVGAVYVRMGDEDLTVSNPGGFVEGVNLQNLLIVEPHPRNPLLADVMKRIGLAERTGRGVDLIYAGSLRYGRPAPDYSRSTSNTVVVRIGGAQGNILFYKMILEEEYRLDKQMPLDYLIILGRILKERRIDIDTAAHAIQKTTSDARSVLGLLVEAGLVERRGPKNEAFYIFSASVYRRLEIPADYVRQAGFDILQKKQLIAQYTIQHGSITRHQAMELCDLTKNQADYLLRSLRYEGLLKAIGHGGGAYNVPVQIPSSIRRISRKGKHPKHIEGT